MGKIYKLPINLTKGRLFIMAQLKEIQASNCIHKQSTKSRAARY